MEKTADFIAGMLYYHKGCPEYSWLGCELVTSAGAGYERNVVLFALPPHPSAGHPYNMDHPTVHEDFAPVPDRHLFQGTVTGRMSSAGPANAANAPRDVVVETARALFGLLPSEDPNKAQLAAARSLVRAQSCRPTASPEELARRILGPEFPGPIDPLPGEKVDDHE